MVDEPRSYLLALSVHIGDHFKALFIPGGIIQDREWVQYYIELQQLTPNNPYLRHLGLPLTQIKQGFRTGEYSFLYLVRPWEFVEKGVCIFKLGKTGQSPGERMKEYCHGTEIYDLREVSNRDLAEEDLKEAFRGASPYIKEEKVTEQSREYFTGNLLQMRRIFNEVCKRYPPVLAGEEYLCNLPEESFSEHKEISEEEDSETEEPDSEFLPEESFEESSDKEEPEGCKTGKDENEPGNIEFPDYIRWSVQNGEDVLSVGVTFVSQ